MKNTLLKCLSVLLAVCIFSFCAVACNDGSGGGIVNFDSEGPQTEVLEITSPNAEEVDIFSVDYRPVKYIFINIVANNCDQCYEIIHWNNSDYAFPQKMIRI